jgi:membrane-bound lytic murein transglycosylase B
VLAALLAVALHPAPLVAGQPKPADAEPAKSKPTQSPPAKEARPARPSPPSTGRPSRAQVRKMISEVAQQYGVEEALVRAVVAAESSYNAHAVSHAGAVGLMQVMPATAGDYGVTSTAALFDPKTNLRTGTRHLKRLLKKYNNDYGRAIMAYNAGEGVVDRTNSNVTFRETLDYTEAVIRNYRGNGGTRPTGEAMAKVAALRKVSGHGSRTGNAKARRLLKKYLDPSLLSLSVKPTLSRRMLDPDLHAVGPESRPMFELDVEAMR